MVFINRARHTQWQERYDRMFLTVLYWNYVKKPGPACGVAF